MATSAPVVSLDGVTCRYGDVVAVDGVSLQLPRGVLVGLVGPSGSGKTTIVRTMRGGVAPASGAVKVFGNDPRHMPQRDRKRLGYMPQQFSLYPDLTAQENVDFVASLFGLLFPKRRRRTREVLRAVDLWQVRGRRADRLSGGMQRRLQLAATLVHDPDLLLLDEPTAGLDPLLRARVWEEVRRLRDAGRTILVTTQYVGEAEECEVVALIVEGRLAAIGAPEELRVQAIGGELLVVETSRELTDDEWREMPEVLAVRPIGPRRTRLTVSSAARALPQIVERLRAQDTSVVEASEERPSFDDVFAALVHRANRDGARAQTEAPDGTVETREQRDDAEALAPAPPAMAALPVTAAQAATPSAETAPPPAAVDPATGTPPWAPPSADQATTPPPAPPSADQATTPPPAPPSAAEVATPPPAVPPIATPGAPGPAPAAPAPTAVAEPSDAASASQPDAAEQQAAAITGPGGRR